MSNQKKNNIRSASTLHQNKFLTQPPINKFKYRKSDSVSAQQYALMAKNDIGESILQEIISKCFKISQEQKLAIQAVDHYLEKIFAIEDCFGDCNIVQQQSDLALECQPKKVQQFRQAKQVPKRKLTEAITENLRKVPQHHQSLHQNPINSKNKHFQYSKISRQKENLPKLEQISLDCIIPIPYQHQVVQQQPIYDSMRASLQAMQNLWKKNAKRNQNISSFHESNKQQVKDRTKQFAFCNDGSMIKIKTNKKRDFENQLVVVKHGAEQRKVNMLKCQQEKVVNNNKVSNVNQASSFYNPDDKNIFLDERLAKITRIQKNVKLQTKQVTAQNIGTTNTNKLRTIKLPKILNN